MSKNYRTTRIINEVIKQLASGTNIVLHKKRLTLYPYLSKDLRDSLPKTKGPAISKQVIRYMRQQDLVNLQDHPQGQIKLRLSDVGINRASKISLQELTIPRPTRWDRKWRLIYFDIPETQRAQRNRLVAKLKTLGFCQLQRSLWVHPYPCHIEIEYLKRVYNLRPYVHLAEVYKIDQQTRLLARFRGLVPQKRMS